MAYTAWSVVYGEQPTAAKWNQLGANDAGFKDGTNIDAGAITNAHLASGIGAQKLSNPYKFSAHKTAAVNQATTAGVPAKIAYQTERFDTNSNYDNSTYRYTIPVTGYYFINAIIQTLRGDNVTDSNIAIYKNGATFRKGGNLKNGVYPQHQVIGFFQFTAGDYLEVYFVNIAQADNLEGNSGSSTFEGFLVSST